ncbi:MAG TPA: XRE family transcriptional regulator [Dehalococcoidia bacterium]|nr:XRE family transcriptional regulator [Dehalococcoidia bacterium]
MTTAMEQLAHRQATKAAISEVAAALQSVLGQQITAVIAGIKDAKAVGQWARGEREPHPAAARRLRSAFQVAQLLLQVDDPGVVRAWFVGMNPLLEDESPALALTHEPAKVMDAARAFAYSG